VPIFWEGERVGFAASRAQLALTQPQRLERYAEWAVEWNRAGADCDAETRAQVLLSGQILPFMRPRRGLLEPLRAAADRLCESGDLRNALDAGVLRLTYRVLVGEPLGDIARERDRWAEDLRGLCERPVLLPDPLLELLSAPALPAAQREAQLEALERTLRE